MVFMWTEPFWFVAHMEPAVKLNLGHIWVNYLKSWRKCYLVYILVYFFCDLITLCLLIIIISTTLKMILSNYFMGTHKGLFFFHVYHDPFSNIILCSLKEYKSRCPFPHHQHGSASNSQQHHGLPYPSVFLWISQQISTYPFICRCFREPQEGKLQEEQGFCLFCSLLYPQSLEECLARSIDSINNYWVNEQMNVFADLGWCPVTPELTAHYLGASAFVCVFLLVCGSLQISLLFLYCPRNVS